MCCLGFLYESGEGVEQNWREAVKWYRKAAELELSRAQCNLAWCYEHGKGVEQDLAEAVAWYRKAADQGDPRGLFCMARAYDYGLGVEQDGPVVPESGSGRLCAGHVRSWRVLRAGRGHRAGYGPGG